ncbi:hypothetical protein [Terrisporobacter vanillatitrophus]|uniref:hypothetical protein n=1 Tax=Terrisporobacter vanillatitrophus TaxID=3058402 RepID=UPI0033663565
MKYIKGIISILTIIAAILYFCNIEKGISSFVLYLLIALQNTIIFWELCKENKKKESILNAVVALMFWVIVFINI